MNNYSSIDLDIFIDECFNPLNSHMKEINNDYTVRAKATASPQSWSAPLTVTFDARSSTDPSNDTIPSNNFFWYYKNADGVDVMMGEWSVINYTFERAGNYHIHLTARSANRSTQGILDGSADVVVNVAPEAANLVVYANGRKLKEKTYTKIGTTEAENGIIIDGAASLAKWWRVIQQHSWEIKWDKWYKYFSDILGGSPGDMTLLLPESGGYVITLSLLDNESNTTSKSFLLSVSDPIAVINKKPELITSSAEVSFDASASYSIDSRIKRYNREIFNTEWDIEFVSQQKSIKHSFSKPGAYLVKLTVTDELNKIDVDQQEILVESTPPQAQFSITPRLDREKPSQFVLDASSSFDIDVQNWYDVLNYERSFSKPWSSVIEQEYDEGESVVVSFNEPWSYTISLKVTDSYGKSHILERSLNVQSSLRPIIIANPRAAPRGQTIRFIVQANKDIINYEWDFGDGQQASIMENMTTHSFKSSGVYNVKLTTTDTRWDSNSISTLVFIGDKDAPIGAYVVTNERGNILRADQACEGNPAYLIRRGEKFSIDTRWSVNAKWNTRGLKFYFTPQNDEIYSTSSAFSYNFSDSLWCQKIDLLVEDTALSQTDQETVWFYVINSLPRLDGIGMNFPQFGNDIGIWLDQRSQQSTDFNPLDFNPLVVKLAAKNPKDFDGTISQYLWYYYKASDPANIIDLKATPGAVPYTYFTIYTRDESLGGGDIVFGVKLIDNDGGEVKSEDIIWQGPGFFIPPCTTSGSCEQNMDVPIVTLSASTRNVNVGDVVSFKVDAKILSQRPDFASQRVVRYDFDGDGTWDLVTKSLEVEHEYTTPKESIVPRVEVSYRKNTVAVSGPELSVKQRLKARLEVVSLDDTVYVRDYSVWDIAKRELCFEHTTWCVEFEEWERMLHHRYASFWKKSLFYTISDHYGNKAHMQHTLELEEPQSTKTTQIVSIPQITIQSWQYVLPVGSHQDNQVFFYVQYTGTGSCYVDLDISKDSDYDGDPQNDRDLLCNNPQVLNLDAYSDAVRARLVYENDKGGLIGNWILFQFPDQGIDMTNEQQESYNRVMSFADTLPKDNDSQLYAKSLVQELAQNLRSDKDQTETIINLRVYMEDEDLWWTQEQKTTIESLLQEFATSTSIELQGWNIVDQVRQFLIDYAPSQLMKSSIRSSFVRIQDLEEPGSKPDIVKSELESVLQVFQENSVKIADISKPWNEEKIIEWDVETQILPRICEVLEYYQIPSRLCPDLDNASWSEIKLPNTNKKQKTIMGTILKWVGIIVGSLLLIFVLIVVFFALRARLQDSQDEELLQDSQPKQPSPDPQPQESSQDSQEETSEE